MRPWSPTSADKLDGVPLAIELAAARVDLLGVRELSARLEEGSQVLRVGAARCCPAIRTMRATLDWSYGLLSPPEQTVLSRLAIFAGGFTLAAAAAVVGDADLGEEEVVDLVLELATKSLLAAEGNFLGPRFRLLATTRAYALEKARERAELDTLAQRHATYFLTLFDSVRASMPSSTKRPTPLHSRSTTCAPHSNGRSRHRAIRRSA